MGLNMKRTTAIRGITLLIILALALLSFGYELGRANKPNSPIVVKKLTMLDRLNQLELGAWTQTAPNSVWGVGASAEYDANGCELIDFPNSDVEKAATINGVGALGSHAWVVPSIFMSEKDHKFLLVAANLSVPCLKIAGTVLGYPNISNQ